MVVAAAAVSCLALLPVTSAQGAVQAPWAAPRPGYAYSLVRLQRPARESGHPRGHVADEPAAGCEQKLEHAQHQDAHDGHGLPAVVIVGASFTAGVGSGSPGKSWAVVLARRLHWDAVVYGDPGAGYVRAGVGREGPVAAEIARVDLRAVAPALVIVQAGHDDIGVPPRLEQRLVEQAVALIQVEAPHARIALLTGFAGRSRPAAAGAGASETAARSAFISVVQAQTEQVLQASCRSAYFLWVFHKPAAACGSWSTTHPPATPRPTGGRLQGLSVFSAAAGVGLPAQPNPSLGDA